MTPLQWILLCILFTLYLLFGGSVFMYFEQHREIQTKEEITVLRKDIRETLIFLDRDFYHNKTTREMIHALTKAKIAVLHRISAVCDAGDLLPPGVVIEDYETHSLTTTEEPSAQNEEEEDKLKWNFYNSVFFAFTVITTIGYGHLSPQTRSSKIFVMIYALIGIPINSILLSGLGDYFSSRLVKVHKKSKDKPNKRFTFILEILFYLIPGCVVFIILPAGIFVLIEEWTFLDSVYYAFVSLTTIGFGDYVAGMGNGHTVWMWIYKAFIIIWITFGLGYLIMILGFISKGLTHKRVRVVIEKRLNTIRVTKDKLTRDIDYMRRVVNELYMMKVKPVYEAESSYDNEDYKNKSLRKHGQTCLKYERRCSSYPLLPSIGLQKEDEDKVKFSIGEPEPTTPIIKRRCSDSDLDNINRDKTFEAALRNQVIIDELLVTVVNALSGNVMHEVIEAVEELNKYEQDVHVMTEELDKDDKEERMPSRNHSKEHPEGHYWHEQHHRREEDLPPWDLGALSESDEEVLIEKDENENENDEGDALRQVVVHNNSESGLVKQPSSTILEKVSGAIRKISTGSKSGSEAPSRKVSRNEAHKKKPSRTDSFEQRYLGYHSNSRPHLNPHERKISSRKISEESRASNTSMRSRLTDLAPYTNGYGSNASSRKISPAIFPNERDSEGRQKVSLETTSLAEFLHALDHVHSKLSSNKTSVASMSGESEFSESPSTLHPRLPIIRRSVRRRMSDQFGQPNTDLSGNTRQRKNGIVHPDFAYMNDSFEFDEHESRTSPTKYPSHSNSTKK